MGNRKRTSETAVNKHKSWQGLCFWLLGMLVWVRHQPRLLQGSIPWKKVDFKTSSPNFMSLLPRQAFLLICSLNYITCQVLIEIYVICNRGNVNKTGARVYHSPLTVTDSRTRHGELNRTQRKELSAWCSFTRRWVGGLQQN